MMFLTIEVRPRGRGPIRLWLPMVLVWLLLLPFAVLLAPFLALWMIIRRMNPFRAMGALLGLLTALSGTRIEVDSPSAFVNIRLV
jgi:hypothetical protein